MTIPGYEFQNLISEVMDRDACADCCGPGLALAQAASGPPDPTHTYYNIAVDGIVSTAISLAWCELTITTTTHYDDSGIQVGEPTITYTYEDKAGAGTTAADGTLILGPFPLPIPVTTGDPLLDRVVVQKVYSVCGPEPAYVILQCTTSQYDQTLKKQGFTEYLSEPTVTPKVYGTETASGTWDGCSAWGTPGLSWSGTQTYSIDQDHTYADHLSADAESYKSADNFTPDSLERPENSATGTVRSWNFLTACTPIDSTATLTMQLSNEFTTTALQNQAAALLAANTPNVTIPPGLAPNVSFRLEKPVQPGSASHPHAGPPLRFAYALNLQAKDEMEVEQAVAAFSVQGIFLGVLEGPSQNLLANFNVLTRTLDLTTGVSSDATSSQTIDLSDSASVYAATMDLPSLNQRVEMIFSQVPTIIAAHSTYPVYTID